MKMLYCGSDDAMSCPSQLSMLPRIGSVFKLSTFTRSATSSQNAARNADITFSDVQLTTTGSSSPAGGGAAQGSSLDKLRQLPAALSDAVENWYYDTMLLF